MSESTNTMFPNYQAPDSIIVIQQQQQQANNANTDLKRRNSVRSVNNKHDEPDGEENKKKSGALRDFFTSRYGLILKTLFRVTFSVSVLALSIHAVFEGMAVGLEEAAEDVWTLFTAIAVHKFVIMFCVCMELQQSTKATSKLAFFSYLTTFSFISPVGIGIGILISETSAIQDELVTATLQGIAGGTILYIVMFEVLNREREKNVHGMIQLFGIILGFCAMLLIEIFSKI